MTTLEINSRLTIEVGLNFILGHLEPPIWPRTISTSTTEGKQILVYNREEALAWFKAAKFLDCRISAYPKYTEWNGINRQAPDLIFIDLDLSHFKSIEALDRALRKTLKNIKGKLDNAHPTVVWSGNGYHIYLPIKAFMLESESVFAEFEKPSMKFLRFVEQSLANNKADPCHSNNLSFKNCMLRIPGSYNSKYILFKDKGEIVNIPPEAEVKIFQRWNGVRPAINWLLRDFRRYLIQDRHEEATEQKRLEKSKYFLPCNNSAARMTFWIEKLFQIPLNDHRKFAVRLVFAPYFMNFRSVSYDTAFNMIKDWLARCNSIRRLDFKADRYIQEKLKEAQNVGYFYITLDKIKTKNRPFYDLLNAEKII